MPNWMQDISRAPDYSSGETAGQAVGGIANLVIGGIAAHRRKKEAEAAALKEQQRYERDEAQQDAGIAISQGNLDVSRGNLANAQRGTARAEIEAGFRSPTPGGGSGRATNNPVQGAIDQLATIRSRTAKGVMFDVPAGGAPAQSDNMTELGEYNPLRSKEGVMQEDRQAHDIRMQGLRNAADMAGKEFDVAHRAPPAERNVDPLSKEGIAARLEFERKQSLIPNRPSGNPADEKVPTENAQAQRAAKYVKTALFQNPALARDPQALAAAANKLLQNYFANNMNENLGVELGEQRRIIESEVQKHLSTPAAQRAAAGGSYDEEPPGRAQGQSDNAYMNALMDWGMDPAEARAKVQATKAGAGGG